MASQGFLFMVGAELPQVFMDTEENTRLTLAHLRDEAQRRETASRPVLATAQQVEKTAAVASRFPKPGSV